MGVKIRDDGVVQIAAPQRLGVFQDRLPATINFIDDLREQFAIPSNLKFEIDLSGCRAISRAACLIVTAELKRALYLYKQRKGLLIEVLTPEDPHLATLLDTFGLYTYFGVESPVTEEARRVMRGTAIVVRSGGSTVEAAYRQFTEIGEVAAEVCGEAALAKEVERALQEALGNAEEHAYADIDSVPPDAKWWFAGLFIRESNEAYFYALDHGVGIPSRVEQLMAAELEAFWATDASGAPRPAGLRDDRDRLRGAIRAPRSGEGERKGRGKGLPYMVGLIDTALDGQVRIVSGAASWHSRRLKNVPPGGSIIVDRCYSLRRSFPGTLVCWRIIGALPQKAVST